MILFLPNVHLMKKKNSSNFFKLSWKKVLLYIYISAAGTNKTLFLAAQTKVVTGFSAIALVIFPIVLTVAGTTTIKSAHSA